MEAAGVLPATHELGIGCVGYSPLGRGFLSGNIATPADFEPGDSRRFFPRYQGENFTRNLALVQTLGAVAQAISGTKRRTYLKENVAAAHVSLTPVELAQLAALLPVGSVAGAACPEAFS